MDEARRLGLSSAVVGHKATSFLEIRGAKVRQMPGRAKLRLPDANADRAGLAACLALTTGVAVADIAIGKSAVVIGLLIVGPLSAAGLCSPRATLGFGFYAVGLALVLGVVDGLGGLDYAMRVVVVAVGSALAVWLAYGRARREAALLQLTQVAEAAQRAILRAIPRRAGPVSLSARYLSASADALIGGDFYDVASTPFGVRAILGDVRGKGLDAVRLAAVMLRSFREHAYARASLLDLAGELDKSLTSELAAEDFVTAVIVNFTSQGLDLLNCGHPAPLAVTAGDHRWLAPSVVTTPFGLEPDLKVDSFSLQPGSRVLFYSDGLIESRSPGGDFFPLESAGVPCLRRRSLNDALDSLVDELVDHAGGRVDDDLALLLAEMDVRRRASNRPST